LWAEKTKRVEREHVASEAAEWGTRLEDVIRDKFAEAHPELKVYNDKSSWANTDRPWQLSNVDGFYEDAVGNKGILEIKTAAYEDDWKDGEGNWIVPQYYMTQVQWYLQTFGFAEAWVAVLFAGRKYVEIPVEANPFQQEMNLIAAERFRKYWLEDRQPDWDGSSSTLETVRKMNPEIDPADEHELGELGNSYLDALLVHERATEQLNEYKSRVLHAMGRAKRGTIEGAWRLTRQARNGGTPYLVNKKG
jgi:predicted phage-related endonuclease